MSLRHALGLGGRQARGQAPASLRGRPTESARETGQGEGERERESERASERASFHHSTDYPKAGAREQRGGLASHAPRKKERESEQKKKQRNRAKIKNKKERKRERPESLDWRRTPSGAAQFPGGAEMSGPESPKQATGTSFPLPENVLNMGPCRFGVSTLEVGPQAACGCHRAWAKLASKLRPQKQRWERNADETKTKKQRERERDLERPHRVKMPGAPAPSP